MTPEETRAAGSLTARTIAGTVRHIEQTHLGVASRPFGLSGRAGRPVRMVHDAVSRTVYGTIRTALLAAGMAASEVLTAAARSRPTAEPAGATLAGNLTIAALNAAIGDRLHLEDNPLAIRMAIRVDGRDVPPDRSALAAAFPGATSKVAVFLHGLMETEDAWRLHARRHYDDPQVCYGTLLARDLGYTPVYIRYNTGRHVSETGRGLVRLLSELVGAWPAAVDEVLLVGHSMGGLVARSGCHQGDESGAPWVPLVRHVVCLGSPHLGAPLERAAGHAGRAMARLAETRSLATLISGRSVGIKDLRFGYLVDADWTGCDPDTCLTDHRTDVPLLSTANHYLISATLAGAADSPTGRLIGDLLVLPASASGGHRSGRHIPFPVGNHQHFGGLHHFHLLNHPDVYRTMRGWLS
jgi:pimeloyl-ACP methyl ester carboxylesterase